jgi:hypothetical protein
MRHVYDEFDEFDYSDDDLVSRYMREQEMEERRLANRRRRGSVSRRRAERFDDDDLSDVESYEEFSHYDEDEDELDTYS